MQTITPLLQINNLSINFLTANNTLVNVVKRISATIQKGEVVAIVGESGSGKSVTSLAILQLLPQKTVRYTGGEILWNNNGKTINLLKQDKQALQQIRGKKIAMIFQEPMTSLNPVLTCGYQVKEAIMLHENIALNEARKKVIDLFRKVKLDNPQDVFNKYPHQLSGGQKQRVMIAMAICCNPDLLICDEPTTALDVTVQQSILHLIKELQLSNNMSVIFITHDLGVVAEIADKIIVLYKGEIVESNTTENVLKYPTNAYTKALLACRPALYNKREKLPVVSDFLNELNSQEVLKNIEQINTINKQEPLVEVKNLHVVYVTNKNLLGKATAKYTAVKEVNFTIYKGETLGLVGESGCGKTTLGRTILNLIKPTSGEIIYHNLSNYKSGKERKVAFRRKMQLIFQDPYSSLNPAIAIGDAIAEPIIIHKLMPNAKKAKEQAIMLLQKVGLKEMDYNKYPHEFSGGQRQRIVIARALAMQPEFIVCDESVSALDVSIQAQVLNLLNELKVEFNFTVLFISHDLAVVKYISDRIMVMKSGEIVEMNDAEMIFNQPQSSYTKQLIEAIPTTQ
ncbi:MAG TPA: ABC transporter ATP-binding protein [Chitinophagaceae bacterium]|nr:ABC transporter ATP-binding protein [Chitinophagaceae bacterium]